MSGNLVPSNSNGPSSEVVAYRPPTAGPLVSGWRAAPPADDESGPAWHRYISALKRYKWLMLVVLLAGTAFGVVATRFVTPEYEVHGTIWISRGSGGGEGRDNQGPIQAQQLLASAAWTELLKSFTIADPVVLQLKLYLQPEEPRDSVLFRDFALGPNARTGSYALQMDRNGHNWTLEDAKGTLVDHGATGDSVGRAVGFQWVPPVTMLTPGRTVKFGVIQPRDASMRLINKLQTRLPDESQFLQVNMTGTDPVKTATTLNAWLRQFVAGAGVLKRRNVTEFSNILRGQLSFAENELRNAENALESFRVNTITLPSEASTPVMPGVDLTKDPLMDAYFTQRIQYEDVKRDEETLRGMLASANKGSFDANLLLAAPNILATAPDLKNALDLLNTKQSQLTAAKQFYTDEYKTVKDLQSQVDALQTQTIPTLIRQTLSQLQDREAEMGRRIDIQSTAIKDIPARTIEEMRLRRQVTVSENLYTSLQSRYEEAKLAEASMVPDVTVLDSAVAPRFPTNNTGPRIIFIAILASLGAAIALALLLDRLDRRFRYPEQATHELGLSILGAIPFVGKDATKNPEEAAQVVEAFRALRLSLKHLFNDGPLVLTISSPGAGDGKSMVCSNLALSFAEAGYRTILVDGDIRRGELHATFDVQRRPGLLDYLLGTSSPEEIIRETTHENLWMIPCGTRRHRGPELLASERTVRFIKMLREKYEVVIVDSAPLGAGIDPFALGTATGSLLVVLRTGKTDRKMAEAKLQMLDRLPVRILGAVLNDIRTGGVYQYYSYLYGYALEDDEAAPELASSVGRLSRS